MSLLFLIVCAYLFLRACWNVSDAWRMTDGPKRRALVISSLPHSALLMAASVIGFNTHSWLILGIGIAVAFAGGLLLAPIAIWAAERFSVADTSE